MPKQHHVAPGECLSSIAFRYGLRAETIWDQPENEELRKHRPNMFQLVPGDVVCIPDLRRRSEIIATGQRHRFRRLNVPEKLRIQLKDEGARPRSDLAYTLTVDGKAQTGTTDGEGRIEVFIPPDAASALLVIEGADGEEEHELALGHDTPAAHIPALLAMLRSAGFLGKAEDVPTVIEALRSYQGARGLEVTGDADRATMVALHQETAERT
jgi:hypothetical protein